MVGVMKTNMVNRTGSCPHTALALGTFKGRASRGTGADQKIIVTDNNFSISSDIYEHSDFFAHAHSTGKNSTYGVGTYKTGDTGKAVQQPAGIDVQTHFRSPKSWKAIRRSNIGFLANIGRWETQKQM